MAMASHIPSTHKGHELRFSSATTIFITYATVRLPSAAFIRNSEDSKNTDCVYQIPIGETGRTFGTRLEEHKQEVENVTTRRFTREQTRVSTAIEHTSAITDHADRNICIIDWEGANVIDRECNINAR